MNEQRRQAIGGDLPNGALCGARYSNTQRAGKIYSAARELFAAISVAASAALIVTFICLCIVVRVEAGS